MSLFDGYRGAHGVYNISASAVPDDNGKIKGRAATVKSPVTAELWDDHLMGKQGLGVIPINEQSMCKFGAIDIDDYRLNASSIARTVQDNKLPLLVCKTKSGGVHLYLCCSEFIPAKTMYGKLKEIASFLGFGNSEIFPKQTKILIDRGDIGQWINMPYFGGFNTERYCLDEGFRKLPVEKFMAFASERIVSPEQLTSMKLTGDNLYGGPPCLQVLTRTGFPQGVRNQGLFALGVYAQKSNPDGWQADLEKLNNEYMKPPLTPKEVLGVVSSLTKKKYNYACQTEPIKSHCDTNKCRACKFGVGGLTGMPLMGSLTKLNTTPPIWFVEVQGGSKIELSTEELQSPTLFQRRCMETLNVMPPILKRDTWEITIAGLMENVNVVDVPHEATVQGMLKEHLKTYCGGSVQGKSMDELLLGKPYTSAERHYFRLKDFQAYLKRIKFDDMKTNKITSTIKSFGGEHGFSNLKGVGTNYWSIPIFENRQTESFDTPSFGGNAL